MQSDIDNVIGTFFPKSTVTIGYILTGASVLLIFINPILGILSGLVGLVISFLRTGVEINIQNNSLREYTSFFGFKSGAWVSNEDLTDVIVLQKRMKTTAFSRANRPAITEDETCFDICLADKSHRTKKMVNRLSKSDEAVAQAKQLADQLGLTYSTYNPEISAETRAKRK